MPIQRGNDSRGDPQKDADTSALKAFERGEFLSNQNAEATAILRANSRARAIAVSKKLGELRQVLGVTQEQVAEMLGTQNTDISRMESGRHVLQLDRLLMVVTALEKLSGLKLDLQALLEER